MENYFAAACVQIALDCWAACCWRILCGALCPGAWASRGAGSTLWLAALCPFTASYAVAPLAETPTLFVLALALWAMARFHDRPAG